jgi:type II secretory pathway pseudopilin PulG
MKLKIQTKKHKSAYSLVELLISISITSILLAMLFNTIFVSIKSSSISAYRNLISNEISSINNQISYDIRNLDIIINCLDTSECIFSKDGVIYKWSICEESMMCKSVVNEEAEVLVSKLGSNIIIDTLLFQLENIELGSNTQKIYITYTYTPKNSGIIYGDETIRSINQINVSLRQF